MKLNKTKNTDRRSRGKILLVGFVTLFAAIVLVSVFTSTTHAPAAGRVATVQITSQGFQPSTLSVRPGTKIIWTSKIKALTQVASNPYPGDGALPGLKSQILNEGQTFSYTANKSGTFGYHDDQKPTINGTIIVEKK